MTLREKIKRCGGQALDLARRVFVCGRRGHAWSVKGRDDGYEYDHDLDAFKLPYVCSECRAEQLVLESREEALRRFDKDLRSWSRQVGIRPLFRAPRPY